MRQKQGYGCKLEWRLPRFSSKQASSRIPIALSMAAFSVREPVSLVNSEKTIVMSYTIGHEDGMNLYSTGRAGLTQTREVNPPSWWVAFPAGNYSTYNAEQQKRRDTVEYCAVEQDCVP